MPPTDRFVISFAAEPPREPTPYGRWADTLTAHFLGACHALETDGEDLGEAGAIAWFPDRSYGGRTYVPAVARTTTGYELFGFVSFTHPVGGAPTEFQARADFTSETADSNPDWNLDLNDEVVSSWQGGTRQRCRHHADLGRTDGRRRCDRHRRARRPGGRSVRARRGAVHAAVGR